PRAVGGRGGHCVRFHCGSRARASGTADARGGRWSLVLGRLQQLVRDYALQPQQALRFGGGRARGSVDRGAGTVAVISFIVPAYNEERLLGATLTAVHAAAAALAEDYEIVVADDASTDATAEVARSCGARVISVAHRQIAATRNAGARAGRGDRYIFVD